MKLNWFSPLTMARSDIAHYTARTLVALRRYADVTLWTDQAEWDPVFDELAAVRRYGPDPLPWGEFNDADISFFHFGNHPCHSGIWQVSRSLPGIAVLHELRLHDLFYGMFHRHLRKDQYLRCLEKCYGEAGRAAAERNWEGDPSQDFEMGERFPMTPAVLEGAAGVLVHTPDAFAQAVASDVFPVKQLHLPYPATTRPEPAVAKASRGGAGPFRLIVFGHLSRNRRLNAVLQGLATFPQRERFHLDIYGSLPDPRFVDGQIAALGLRPLVTVHGFVPEADLDAALAAADLAFNLRYPSMGEASGSQMRIWDHALPSLVSAVGWYRTLSANVVGHIRPDEEIADIHAHLTAFVADPGSYVRQGAAGRRLLEEHHAPDSYARSLVEFAKVVERFRLRRLAGQLVERVGMELSAWSSLRSAWTIYANTAEQIRRLAG